MVKRFESDFGRFVGSGFTVACSSGSAAVHAAVAAIDPEPGDEIITTSVTDMGALAPIVYQGAIPVFADVDPMSGNVTAENRRPALTAHQGGGGHPPLREPGRCDRNCRSRQERWSANYRRLAPRRTVPGSLRPMLGLSVRSAPSAFSRENTSPPARGGGVGGFRLVGDCPSDAFVHQQSPGTTTPLAITTSSPPIIE